MKYTKVILYDAPYDTRSYCMTWAISEMDNFAILGSILNCRVIFDKPLRLELSDDSHRVYEGMSADNSEQMKLAFSAIANEYERLKMGLAA